MLRNKLPADIVNAMNKSRNKKEIPNGKFGKKYTAFKIVGNETCHIVQS